jgi:hypothetical protein
VHDHVAIGHPLIDLVDTVHGQRRREDFAGFRIFAARFVCAMAGADGDGERIKAGLLDKFFRLVRIGQVVLHFALAQAGAVAVFDTTEYAEFPLDRYAQRMGHINGRLGDLDVLFVGVRAFSVFAERAVHHDGGKPEVDGGFQGLEAVAVVEMQGYGNVGVFFTGSFHELLEVNEAAVLKGAAAGLDDYRAVGFVGRLHDGLDLLHVIDVEGAHTVTAFGGLIQNLTHWHEWHGTVLLSISKAALSYTA